MIRATIASIVKKRIRKSSQVFSLFIDLLKQILEKRLRELLPDLSIKVRDRDQFILDQMESAFSSTLANRTLSKRLWIASQRLTQILDRTLAEGIKSSKQIDDLVSEMQSAIDSANQSHHALEAKFGQDWMSRLHKVSSRLIQDPSQRAKWNQAMRKARTLVEQITNEPQRNRALGILSKLSAGVTNANQRLIDSALNDHLVDRQSKYLERIARTERGIAQIRAVGDANRSDPDVIGFRWMLNTLHDHEPEPDICDKLANIEVGFGRGVFSKKEFPRSVGHPNCRCKIIPVILPNKERGSVSLSSIRNELPQGFLSTD